MPKALLEEYSMKMGAFSPYDWALKNAGTLDLVAEIMVEYYKAHDEWELERMHLHKRPESRCLAQDKLLACRIIHEAMANFLAVSKQQAPLPDPLQYPVGPRLIFAVIDVLNLAEESSEETAARLIIRAAKRRAILAAASLSKAAADREYAQFLYLFYGYETDA